MNFIEKQCDILVIGGGGSGLVAGCRAASLGKSVIILEKDKALGGGMNMASTMRTFQSKWQKERELPDTTSLYMRNRMDETFWRIDKKLAASAIKGTGEFFDWFCEIAPRDVLDQFTVGRYVFDDIEDGPLGPQAGGHGKGKGAGRIFVEVTSEKLLELGGEILTEAVTEDIEIKNGKITTAIVNHSGERLRISCSACILACGAWIRNEEFVKKYYPALSEAIPFMGESPHMNRNYTGDGLLLAAKTGAKIDEKNLTIRMMGPMTMCRSRVMGDIANSAYSIYVNKNGERFVCETSQLRMGIFDSGSVQVEQPDGLAFVVFNESTLARAIADGDNQPKALKNMPFGAAKFPDTLEEAYADINPALEANDGVVFSAASIAELAEKIGVPVDTLQQTVDNYNEYCKTGMDWDCYKPAEHLAPIDSAPYYAVRASLGTDGAFGGVEIDENMQALASGGGTVEGLYVTGDLASGRFVNMGGIKVQILNDMSFAVSSGYIAGGNAAEYVDSI